MYARATSSARSRRGSALISSLVVIVSLLGLVYASIAISVEDVKESRGALDEVRADYLAQSGIERGILFLQDAVKKTNVYDPLEGLTDLFQGGAVLSPYVGEGVVSNGAQVGAFSVTMSSIQETATSITIVLDATGYVPAAPADLLPGETLLAWSAVQTTVQYDLQTSEVFDYAYFINNWGWFYGNTIICNGNARSNGQFDVAGYSPTVTGQPIYSAVNWNGVTASLSGYQDDNGDGLYDGNDGGVFSSWDILAAQNLQGNGGNAANQHDFEDPIEMPNLSDLTQYEAGAIDDNSSISIAGTTMVGAVFGDDPGESGNLYLFGTPADPIVLDGPVVVRGDVIISGTVTGQGAIYAGGNVYVPDSITYLDPPDSTRPDSNAQADTEEWITDNWNKDFLGLFAGENVVVGDHTSSVWKQYVGGWMNSSMNGSAEDAGEDGIPNTFAGLDGIVGTADDDVLENDGVFTTEIYSADDATLGLIPPGFAVGDQIPGTGEDIDGDGQYDGTTTLANVTLGKPLDQATWGGNMPAGGYSNYSDISTLYANNLDAVIYTNHSFCYVVLGGNTAKINGAIVSRNENIIYGTPTIEMNHDSRLLGGSSGMAGELLPRVLTAPEILRWMQLDVDPNRFVVAP